MAAGIGTACSRAGAPWEYETGGTGTGVADFSVADCSGGRDSRKTCPSTGLGSRVEHACSRMARASSRMMTQAAPRMTWAVTSGVRRTRAAGIGAACPRAGAPREQPEAGHTGTSVADFAVADCSGGRADPADSRMTCPSTGPVSRVEHAYSRIARVNSRMMTQAASRSRMSRAVAKRNPEVCNAAGVPLGRDNPGAAV